MSHFKTLTQCTRLTLAALWALVVSAFLAPAASAGPLSGNSDAMAIGEMSLYKLVYSQTAMPVNGSVNGVVTGGAGWYDTDNSADYTDASSYSRTAVYMELVGTDGTTEWALITLPQYTTDISRMDFAPAGDTNVVQSAVAGADIFTSPPPAPPRWGRSLLPARRKTRRTISTPLPTRRLCLRFGAVIMEIKERAAHFMAHRMAPATGGILLRPLATQVTMGVSNSVFTIQFLGKVRVSSG
ncbi:MAG: hypothetical protein Q4D38_05625 [Planctomycetia bacterium]|nr:hypothetical protein [Planctomycetia bacterium]